MEKVYSNKIWASFLQFIEKNFGTEITDRILSECGVDRLQLAEMSGFQTKEFGEVLIASTIRHTGQNDISYQAGRAMQESLGTLEGIISGLTSPALAMRLMSQVEGKLALKTIIHSEPVAKNLYRMRVSFKDGFRENESACQNRIGSYEAFPRFFGLPFGKVEHPKCVFRGDDQCEYLVSIPEYWFIFMRQIAFLLAALAVPLLIFGIFKGTVFLWAGMLAVTSSMGCYAWFKHLLAKQSTEATLYAHEGLAKQNRQLEKDNARISSLQALTVSLGQSLNVRDICSLIVSVLVRDFGYGSSQIWLLENDKVNLSNRAARGYSEDLMAFIRNTSFKMGKDWNNPYGLLIQTLEHGNTLLVNDVDAALEKLTPGTREFITALNPSAFIISPLIHDNKPVGILTAEQHGGGKLDNKDRLLFLSISNIAVNALMKAELFENLEQKILERTRDLEAANHQLLIAKEMAIQSEKLSSLGQMAAGVAHEINNPLNFLVNIIPDVRRDVEALEKIRGLALEGSTNGDLAAKIRELDLKYDLETHLEEKDFVFDRIQKALDKSTRIANSLKVFSRSSAKETLSREKFATMVREVVDLIPQKNLGDTRIELDIPTHFDWKVNKNEIEQAFLALINNAIDAMGQKGRIEIRAAAEANGDILLAFKDQGPGIPEDSLKRIFDPFFTTKPPGKGTGLGLTIASEIVRKYGGNLSVQSVPGKGATFEIRFRKGTEEVEILNNPNLSGLSASENRMEA